MPYPTLDDEVRVPARVEFSHVGDQIAILNVDTGVYFGLDEIGARMWDLMCQCGRLQEVAARLEREFDVEPERLRDDLLHLVQELTDKGLVEIV